MKQPFVTTKTKGREERLPFVNGTTISIDLCLIRIQSILSLLWRHKRGGTHKIYIWASVWCAYWQYNWVMSPTHPGFWRLTTLSALGLSKRTRSALSPRRSEFRVAPDMSLWFWRTRRWCSENWWGYTGILRKDWLTTFKADRDPLSCLFSNISNCSAPSPLQCVPSPSGATDVWSSGSACGMDEYCDAAIVCMTTNNQKWHSHHLRCSRILLEILQT